MTSDNTCNKCSHLLGRRIYPNEWESWRCGHINNYSGTRLHPVSGQQIRIFKIDEDILKIRAFHCEGNWFEEYKTPEPIPSIAGIQATDITFDEKSLSDNAGAAAKRLEAIKQKKSGLANIKADEL